MTESGSGGDSGNSGTGWSAPAPAAAAAPVPGASGMVYADVPNRAIAYIIDAILIAIIGGIVQALLGGFGLSVISGDLATGLTYNYAAGLIVGVIQLAISAGYFIYTWTSMRATVGMRVLGMQIGNAADGKTLTMDQAIRRWLVISAPAVIAQVLQPIPAIGFILVIVAFAWFLYLLYTTYKSATKQGFHDVFVGSAVVKASRSA